LSISNFQIRALQRALAVKKEEQRRCTEEVLSAQTLMQMLLDAVGIL